ncbi:hypothetical protein [Litoreibacter janthinus]|uniref:Uncharacterized protein n=1 Tax=Litoreibacter janthinus TaxID=670154 RepID=A0A1I6FRV8_9RHOB|nr:hypothetical protein [Litoreibacter janthinus]SFR32628.1 hypothetical protein SAMN04488002_0170 [Litoreibacter janthinus]
MSKKLTQMQVNGHSTHLVQPIPATLSDLTPRAPLATCGRRIAFEGGLPGAEIEVTDGATVLDTIDYVYGAAWARVPPMLQSAGVHLVQNSCNGQTRTTITPPPNNMPTSLFKPIIWGKLLECMTSVDLDNIAPGATVIMHRDGVESARFDCAEVIATWSGHKPFVKGEEITIHQEYICGGKEDGRAVASGPNITNVQDASQMKKPVVLEPICPDAVLVTIANLTPGARVLFMADGQPLGYSETPSVTHSFPLPKLNAGHKLTVQCELCSKVSPVSDPVEPQPDTNLIGLDASKMYDDRARARLWRGQSEIRAL